MQVVSGRLPALRPGRKRAPAETPAVTTLEQPPVLHSDADLDGLDSGLVRRIRQTVACRDADVLPRVEGAGEIFELDGVRVQRMFNGVLVEEGCYFGDLITPIISRLRGVHEPQEELVVHAIVERLRNEQRAGTLVAPVAIELGSFWSYYSLWFCSALDGARAVAMEPDPGYFAVGPRNAALNGLSDAITFVPGGIAERPGSSFPFTAESDGVTRDTPAYDLRSLMELGGTDRVDVVFCDIQGFETPFLEYAADLLRSGAVRFVVMSTHHSSISGEALTHQNALSRLQELGGHVIAEHTVAESCSGDGLIVVSFDERDRDLVVPVSHVRARDSLFGELEFEVHHQLVQAQQHRAEAEQLRAELGQLREDMQRLRRRTRRLRRESQQLRKELRTTRARLTALRSSTSWRVGRAVVAPLGRLKRR